MMGKKYTESEKAKYLNEWHAAKASDKTLTKKDFANEIGLPRSTLGTWIRKEEDKLEKDQAERESVRRSKIEKDRLNVWRQTAL
ncbi:hypothetical protein LRP52_00015 [Photobacterium sp. ZSDE20]|uniref:Transposase n=1 Tax=Photobacterium pectinilyticum TaxID=2906793 RepID=A0ABT1MVA5_9GAMM|nr:hypothetical protein [Photobacterium sp. ZSDE20]MCQ1056450.1 hypothetical protein [Photobacterium sp. ZSDE20]MDD1820585.1 hypothetical protein [Photobacterium sp. ZSDE20]